MCKAEQELFQKFFPASGKDDAQLGALMDPLCMALYDVLRPACVHLQDLDDLVELVDILKHEVRHQGEVRVKESTVLFPLCCALSFMGPLQKLLCQMTAL